MWSSLLLAACVTQPVVKEGPPPPDADLDGWDTESDCDDGDPALYPGALEFCGDEVDSDCDGDRENCSGLYGLEGATRYEVPAPVGGPPPTFSRLEPQAVEGLLTGVGTDLVVLTQDHGLAPTVHILSQLGHGRFNLAAEASIGLEVDYRSGDGIVAIGNITGTDDVDLLLSTADCLLSVYAGPIADSAPTFVLPRPDDVPCEPFVAIGDTSGDGEMDLHAITGGVSRFDGPFSASTSPTASAEVSTSWMAEKVLNLPTQVDASTDLDGDGVSDLAIGMVGASVPDAGRPFVAVFRGPVMDGAGEADALAIYEGNSAATGLGPDYHMLHPQPDADGDGYPELVIRGWGFSDASVGALGLYSFPGNTSGRWSLADAPRSIRYVAYDKDWFDQREADALADQDFDGDGDLDYLFTMNDPERRVGMVRMVPGPIAGAVDVSTAAWSVSGRGDQVSDRFGNALAWFPDQDGDGRPEIIASDPGAGFGYLWVLWSAGLP